MPALTQREGSVHIYFLCDKEVLERECPPHLTPDYPPPTWEEVGLSDLMVIRRRSLLSGPGMLRATALMTPVLCSHGTALFLWSL